MLNFNLKKMKKYNYKISLIAIITAFLGSMYSCQDFLEEEVYTQFEPESFLQDQAGVDALLNGVYSSATITGSPARNYAFALNEFPTDITWETGGGLNRVVKPIINFTWDASMAFINGQYTRHYRTIARANNVISVVSNLDGVDPSTIAKIQAECRFIRGFSYYLLHNVFGPTPIIEIPSGATVDEIESIGKETPKASEQAYRDYVEADFLFAANTLESGGVSSKANKGSAWALLCKFYLNNKEWQKAADASQEVLNLSYSLYSDYSNLFSVGGESNNEYIYRFECLTTKSANIYMPHAFPPSYPTNLTNFGAQFRTYTAFYETFEDIDIRKSLFLTEYTKKNASTITLLNRDLAGNALDNVRSFKYTPDPNGIGAAHGNDIPYVRLADIILARAEALNELNGPSDASITLINDIRARANATLIDLVDYATKESLRDYILDERARELYTEGLRREDLIRHGRFIERAIARGKDAQAHHVLYPFPQSQIDNNPNLEQNTGY